MTPSQRTRYALALTPILVVFAFGFALYQLYRAVAYLRVGYWQLALIFGFMGIGGIALGTALWRTRKKFRPPSD